jgi:hypothetical protein
MTTKTKKKRGPKKGIKRGPYNYKQKKEQPKVSEVKGKRDDSRIKEVLISLVLEGVKERLSQLSVDSLIGTLRKTLE